MTNRLQNVVEYVCATLTGAVSDDAEWAKVHRGRAASSIRQLEALARDSIAVSREDAERLLSALAWQEHSGDDPAMTREEERFARDGRRSRESKEAQFDKACARHRDLKKRLEDFIGG